MAPEVPHRDYAGQRHVADNSWPPKVREGAGSRSYSPPPDVKLDHVAKSYANVWKIIVVIFGALGAGWGGHSLTGRYLTAESVKPMQDDIRQMRLDVAAIRETLNGQAVSIGQMQGTLRMMPPDPIAVRPH